MSDGARLLEVSPQLLSELDRLRGGACDSVAEVNLLLERSHPRLTVELLSLKRVPAGAGVSYGHTFVSTVETTLGLAALGYGDGMPRKAGNRALVTVTSGGVSHRVPIVGRVAMNAFVVDLGDREVDAGSRVTVFGDPERGELPLTQWAQSVGESPLAVVAALAAKVTVRGVS